MQCNRTDSRRHLHPHDPKSCAQALATVRGLPESILSLNNLIYVFCWAFAVVLSWSATRALLISGFRDEQNTYILLVGPITLALIHYRSRSGLGSYKPPTNTHLAATAGFLFVLGIVQTYLPAGPYWLSLSIFALVLSWLGLAVLCYGYSVFKSFLFPLMFMFLLVPLPSAVHRWLVHVLQLGSLRAATLLFAMVGVPIFQKETILTLPGITIEVAEQCSGIRSGIIFLLTALVLADLFLKSKSRKVLLILAAIPLIAFKNGLRIFTLSTLASYVDPSFLHGYLHRFGGSIFFLLALAMFVTLLSALKRTEQKHVGAPLLPLPGLVQQAGTTTSAMFADNCH